MSPGIKQLLHKALAGVAGLPPVEELYIRQIEGGSINASYQVSTKDNTQWFCKFNDNPQFPDLFVKEARGLTLLANLGPFRIPAIVANTCPESRQALVLEWIDQGTPAPAFWTLFGEQLARLHRVTRPEFGLDEDNYIGALRQDNTPTAHWPEFFIRHRLEPQIRLATDRGLLNDKAIAGFTGASTCGCRSSSRPSHPPCSTAIEVGWRIVKNTRLPQTRLCLAALRPGAVALETGAGFLMRYRRQARTHRPRRILWPSVHGSGDDHALRRLRPCLL